MTLSDKKNLKGLQEKRADIITAGVKILNIIMEKLEIEEITVSEYDNLEGLICQKSKKCINILIFKTDYDKNYSSLLQFLI